VKHAAWVRVSHWIAAASVLALVFTGVEILMVHPRLYWGEAGNDLTPALIELPISRNHRHGGWTGTTAFFAAPNSPVSATRTFDIFNQNGWGRSLHFLAAWTLVIPGIIYVLNGLAAGHFRARIWPRGGDLAPRRVWQDAVEHFRLRVRPATGGPDYGVLQKFAYTFVVFVAAPLMVLTGITMAPAVTAVFPGLLGLFGGYQSARTIHFFTFLAIGAFAIAHVVMVARSGFRRQMKGMTFGR
jgi:thiosulfate reductase cytochrome b subunit